MALDEACVHERTRQEEYEREQALQGHKALAEAELVGEEESDALPSRRDHRILQQEEGERLPYVRESKGAKQRALTAARIATMPPPIPPAPPSRAVGSGRACEARRTRAGHAAERTKM